MSVATAPRTLKTRAQDPSSPLSNPAYQGYLLLRIGFVVAPLLFGLDKFFNILVGWDRYLAPVVNDIVPGLAGAHRQLICGMNLCLLEEAVAGGTGLRAVLDPQPEMCCVAMLP